MRGREELRSHPASTRAWRSWRSWISAAPARPRPLAAPAHHGSGSHAPVGDDPFERDVRIVPSMPRRATSRLYLCYHTQASVSNVRPIQRRPTGRARALGVASRIPRHRAGSPPALSGPRKEARCVHRPLACETSALPRSMRHGARLGPERRTRQIDLSRWLRCGFGSPGLRPLRRVPNARQTDRR
jgi:hypothetical protein